MSIETRRLLFILVPQFHPNTGGVQMTTYKLARWFSGAGFDVGIFSFENAGHIDAPFGTLFSAPVAGGLAADENRQALDETIRSFQPDVIINQNPYEHRIAATLSVCSNALRLGCLRNTLYSVKGNLDSYARTLVPEFVAPLLRNAPGRFCLLQFHKWRHRRDLERILASHDKFVMFGPPNLEELEYFVPNFSRDDVELIPNSVPRVLDDLPRKENRLLWLGRLSYHQKRADRTLPFWERIADQLPDWQFDIVGDGPAMDAIAAQVASQRIPRVNLHGRSEPDRFYERAKIFVMTSVFEGFPNTVVEAQSFGAVPVLFDSFSIARWMINDGVDGVLVPPTDLDTMAAKIIALANGSDVDRTMRAALRNARRFQVDAVGAKWLGLFEQHALPRGGETKRAS